MAEKSCLNPTMDIAESDEEYFGIRRRVFQMDGAGNFHEVIGYLPAADEPLPNADKRYSLCEAIDKIYKRLQYFGYWYGAIPTIPNGFNRNQILYELEQWFRHQSESMPKIERIKRRLFYNTSARQRKQSHPRGPLPGRSEVYFFKNVRQCFSAYKIRRGYLNDARRIMQMNMEYLRYRELHLRFLEINIRTLYYTDALDRTERTNMFEQYRWIQNYHQTHRQ